MKRHEAWRLEYRGQRYMRDLPTDQLLTRAGDFMTNLFTHAPDGRAAVKPIQEDSSSMERFTHVLEEMNIRGMDYTQPKILEAMSVPQPKSPKVMRALEVLARKSWPERILVKFGKRKYMGELVLEGKGRISRGGFYKDESLGRARADNEARVAA